MARHGEKQSCEDRKINVPEPCERSRDTFASQRKAIQARFDQRLAEPASNSRLPWRVLSASSSSATISKNEAAEDESTRVAYKKKDQLLMQAHSLIRITARPSHSRCPPTTTATLEIALSKRPQTDWNVSRFHLRRHIGAEVNNCRAGAGDCDDGGGEEVKCLMRHTW